MNSDGLRRLKCKAPNKHLIEMREKQFHNKNFPSHHIKAIRLAVVAHSAPSCLSECVFPNQ